MTEQNLKIAVFIDFDNIEIGVRTTLNRDFDVGAVLEAVKERGEVITKVAYGDWKRAGDYSRLLTQHAVRMVQRNMTPGGDKNGADINLALDALEMAFTHDHVNAFVIVGGDSDFISLVEKLKQYDRKVFVVGGRQFTAMVLQKNCYEFIAYENLVGSPRGGRQQPQPPPPQQGQGRERQAPTPVTVAQTPLTKAFPLVTRALQVLTDREVTPQLGLLKSTLLQLDSTFSERDYGASSFRDFVEKLAATGLVKVRSAGRSLLVDLSETEEDGAHPAEPASSAEAAEAAPAHTDGQAAPTEPAPEGHGGNGRAEGAAQVSFVDGLHLLERALHTPGAVTRWPMYIRNVKQVLRAVEPGFDERRYGGLVELLRAAQREGWVRIERDRQGVLRVFQGAQLLRQMPVSVAPDVVEGDEPPVPAEGGAEPVAPGADTDVVPSPETTQAAAPVVDPAAEPAEPSAAEGTDQPPEGGEPDPAGATPRRRRKTAGAAPRSSPARKPRARTPTPRKKKGKDVE